MHASDAQMKMDSTIPVPDNPVSPQVCKLCYKQDAKYTCPRCNVQYCSSDCYKCAAHSQCSETFYRECFMTQLKDMRADDQQKMLQILKEQHEESMAEEDTGEDLADRLVNLDLDNEQDIPKIWSRLSEKEKVEFEGMIQNGQLGNMIDIWSPWWLNATAVEDMDQPSAPENTVPEILSAIPNIKELVKSVSPSDNIKFSVVNILFGYVYVCRLFNGDHCSLTLESSEALLRISVSLGSQVLESVESAIHSCLYILSNPNEPLAVSRQFTAGVIQDVSIILSGRPGQPLLWTLIALSDCHKILKLGRKAFQKKLTKAKGSHEERSHAEQVKKDSFLACKKIEFVLSWVREYGQALSSVSHEVNSVASAFASDINKPPTLTSSVRCSSKQASPLIEELN